MMRTIDATAFSNDPLQCVDLRLQLPVRESNISTGCKDSHLAIRIGRRYDQLCHVGRGTLFLRHHVIFKHSFILRGM